MPTLRYLSNISSPLEPRPSLIVIQAKELETESFIFNAVMVFLAAASLIVACLHLRMERMRRHNAEHFNVSATTIDSLASPPTDTAAGLEIELEELDDHDGIDERSGG